MRAVPKQADNGGMSARNDFFDAALEAAAGLAARDAGEDAVAVHGIGHGIGADEQISFHRWDGLVRDDEAVAVTMGDEAPSGQVGIVARGTRFVS